MTVFKAVIFDYDGTLFDSRPAITHCIERAFAAYGRAIPVREAISGAVKTGLPLHDMLILLDESLRSARSALNELITTYRQLYLDEGAPFLKPFAGVVETLRHLHADGARCLVVSNKGLAAVRRSLDDSHLSPFVDMVFADEPGLPKKPDPAIMTDHILPRCAPLRREQILIVGDTELDIHFAKRSGISCCWASYGYGDTEPCRRLKPEYEISSIVQLPALVHGH